MNGEVGSFLEEFGYQRKQQEVTKAAFHYTNLSVCKIACLTALCPSHKKNIDIKLQNVT